MTSLGVLEALKQDVPPCHAVPGKLESKTKVLFAACNILGDRQIVCFQAQTNGYDVCLKTHADARYCVRGLRLSSRV